VRTLKTAIGLGLFEGIADGLSTSGIKVPLDQRGDVRTVAGALEQVIAYRPAVAGCGDQFGSESGQLIYRAVAGTVGLGVASLVCRTLEAAQYQQQCGGDEGHP